MQHELSLLGGITNELRDLPWDWIEGCDSIQQAYRLCMRNAPRYITAQEIADHLGMSRTCVTKCLNADKPNSPNRKFDPIEADDIERLCGNRAISQWLQARREGRLRIQKRRASDAADLTLAGL